MNKLGWIPDFPDHRDLKFKVEQYVELSSSIDLRPDMPPVYQQGGIGSCTANALAAALQFSYKKQNLPDVTPSRLFIYYNERDMEGTINSDSGAMLRDGIKSIAAVGDCPETEWDYIEEKFKDKPTDTCYQDASKIKAIKYESIDQDLYHLKYCLQQGYPFVFGFTVFNSFMSEEVAKTGIMSLPTPYESCAGGHAICALGYDDSKQCFIIRNSWGKDWGLDGHFLMPYEYITHPNLATDFWAINVVG